MNKIYYLMYFFISFKVLFIKKLRNRIIKNYQQNNI